MRLTVRDIRRKAGPKPEIVMVGTPAFARGYRQAHHDPGNDLYQPSVAIEGGVLHVLARKQGTSSKQAAWEYVQGFIAGRRFFNRRPLRIKLDTAPAGTIVCMCTDAIPAIPVGHAGIITGREAHKNRLVINYPNAFGEDVDVLATHNQLVNSGDFLIAGLPASFMKPWLQRPAAPLPGADHPRPLGRFTSNTGLFT